MKRVGNLFPQINSFENLLRASRKARRGKRFRRSTALFELNLEKNLFRLMRLLESKTYVPGEYTDFMRVRKSNVKRCRKRLRILARLYKEGSISLRDVQCSIYSWLGHVQHADSYELRQEILSSTVFRR